LRAYKPPSEELGIFVLRGITLFSSFKNLRSKLGIYAHTTVDDPTQAYFESGRTVSINADLFPFIVVLKN
jgi:hypothetical protein